MNRVTNGIRHFPDSDVGIWIRWTAAVLVIPLLIVVWSRIDGNSHAINSHILEAARKEGAFEARVTLIEETRFKASDWAQQSASIAQKDAELLSLINEVRTKNSIQDERIEELIRDFRHFREEMR